MTITHGTYEKFPDLRNEIVRALASFHDTLALLSKSGPVSVEIKDAFVIGYIVGHTVGLGVDVQETTKTIKRHFSEKEQQEAGKAEKK